MISSQAVTIASALPSSRLPSSWFAWAHAFFVMASARTKCGNCDSRMPEKGKFSTARSVWMPQ